MKTYLTLYLYSRYKVMSKQGGGPGISALTIENMADIILKSYKKPGEDSNIEKLHI